MHEPGPLSTFGAIDTVVDNVKISQGLENIAGVMDRATLVRSHVLPDLGHILHSRHQYHWHTGQPSRFCFISRVLHEGSMRVWWPVRANQEAPGDRFRTSARSKRTQTPMLTSEQIASLGPMVYKRPFAERLQSAGYSILNEVVLNQVLVSFGDAETTEQVIQQVQAEGTSWCGGTVWQGRTAMRISVSSWASSESDIDRSLDAMLRIAAKCAK